MFQIGKFSNWKSLFTSREGREIEIWVGGKKAYTIMTIDEDGDGFFDREWPRHTLTDKELRGLDLKKASMTFLQKQNELSVKSNSFSG